jgi:NAD(P)-dependent dehydrogenase (short-subunit alcohol dehydrogenase family)
MNYLETLFNIENKVTILTGGGGILASAMAKGFLQAKAKVVLLDINEANLKAKVESFRNIGYEVTGFQCDVLNEASLKETYQKILDKFKRIDILINAAGGNMPGATAELDQNVFDLQIDQLKKVIDLNLQGTILPTIIFGKTMAEQKSGSIINISSMASYRAITRVMGYSVAKAAVDNFTKWMAVELALKFGDGIRVNAIAPGFLITNQNRTLLTNEDGSLTERSKAVMNVTPFKRFGEPEELVGTVIWLASDAAKFVTGTTVPIDGGFNVFSGV